MSTLFAIALLAAPPAVAPAPPPLPDVERVASHLDDLYRSKSSHGVISMKVKTRHFARTLQIESWSKGEDFALMVIRAPAREAGTATLRTTEGLWNYAPRADRLMRIPSGLLSESWMGSHFTNDDLMRESSYDDDYDTRLSWHQEGAAALLRMDMIPKKEAAVVYTKIVFYLSAEGWLPVRAEYYDDAEIVRTTLFRDVKDFGGRKMPAVMEVKPADKPDEFTIVTYESITFDAPVDDRVFTPRGLRKAAQRR